MAEKLQYTPGLVSIVTPVYNAERFIGSTIRSVMAQTYTRWEMLLIDDCSADNSAHIIQELAEKDERIKYFRLPQNGGAAVARNEAIQRATGEYLAFLDSDDLWEPEKLQEQVTLADSNEPFVFTAIKTVNEQEEIIKDYVWIPETTDYRHLLRQTVIATSSVMLHRPTIGTFTMPLRRSGQDYATWLMLLRRVKRARGIQKALTTYRVSSNSLSSKKLDSIKQVFSIQTKDEHISKISAAINTLHFCWYAFKKHYIKNHSLCNS